MTDTDFTDNLALLTNIPAQAESLLYSLEQAVRSIGLYLNADKTEFMCFSHNGVMSTFNSKLLKIIDLFTYHSSNISSTESDVNICMRNTWTATDRLLIS